jgi:hypothetical protein
MRPSTLHIPTDPNRVENYGVTEKSTRNGWQGKGLLCKWSVHGSKSHTKWATSRAPLTDKSGLGEIHFTSYHVINRQLGKGGPPPTPSAYHWVTHLGVLQSGPLSLGPRPLLSS